MNLFQFFEAHIQLSNRKGSPMKKVNRLSLVLGALMAVSLWVPSAEAQYTPGGPTYKDFAMANGWLLVNTNGDETWTANREPSDDPDNDGLDNEAEWTGWGSVLNGTAVWYSWNTAHDPSRLPGSSLTELDSDCDGIADYWERHLATDPRNSDSDADGMWDAWEAYVGLNPSDNGTAEPDQAPGMDIDGDGLSNIEEYAGWYCPVWTWKCATTYAEDLDGHKDSNAGGFPFKTLKDNPYWSSPCNFDTDYDGLLDSYEMQWGTLTQFNPRVADDSQADPDRDGLTSWREMCVHPLLAQFQHGSSIPSTARYSIGRYGSASIGWVATGEGVVTPGFLNLAQYDALGNSETAPGTVLWGHPVSRTSDWCGGKGSQRWTSPKDADSDDDALPDGWELEHGLNLLSGTKDQTAENDLYLDVSGALGDPDNDTLMNLQEYWGADQYRIDFITGTGDESNPWIARIINHPALSEFARSLGQANLGSKTLQAPAGYAEPFTGYSPGSGWFGFFDTRLSVLVTNMVVTTNVPPTTNAVVTTNYFPVPGVPPYVDLNDVDYGNFGFLPGYFQPFATAMSGLYYFDANGDGTYTPADNSDPTNSVAGDPVWLAVTTPGFYSTNDVVLYDPNTNLVDGAEASGPLTDAISKVWPMPGRDTDNDGLPDALELQMDVMEGKEPTSPVQSSGPFVKRSALLTSDAGVSPFGPFLTQAADSRRFFSPDFTVETWVYLTPVAGSNNFVGSLIVGEVTFASLTRKAFDLGLTTTNGFESVPYISYQTTFTGMDTRTVAAARSIPYGKWVHLAGVFDHHDNRLSLYINGVLEQTVDMNQGSCSQFAATSPGGSRLVTFGRANGGCGFANRVRMDEIRIWGEPRTSTEVTDNKGRLVDPVQACSSNLYSAVVPNALLAYYTFDDGGLMAVDSTRRAKSSLLAYAYPHTAGVLGYPNQEYLYPDTGFALASDNLLGTGSTYVFDANNPAPVAGMLDASRGAFDSDGDSLPDAWEIANELNPFMWNTPEHSQLGTAAVGGLYDSAWGASEYLIIDWTGELTFRASADFGMTWTNSTATRVATGINQSGPNPLHVIIGQYETTIESSNEYHVVYATTTNWEVRVQQISSYMAVGERWYVSKSGNPISRVSADGLPEVGIESDASRDMDGDELTNIYEYWAHTNPRYAMTYGTGRPDGHEDFDLDGLNNLLEISLGSRPDLGDTDDDSFTDSTEQANGTTTLDSTSPEKNNVLYLDGNPGSYLTLDDRSSLRLPSWTIEARVLPSDLNSLADGQGATILRRALQDTVDNQLVANYELRVVRRGNYLTPEARYTAVDAKGKGVKISVCGVPATYPGHRLPIANASDPYPSGGLSHLAASYDANTKELLLFLNGLKIGSDKTVTQSPPTGGRGARSFVRAGENFKGFIDDIRIWSDVRTAAEISSFMDEDVREEGNLLALYTLDDGGWPAQQVKASVISRQASPPANPASGDRYLVDVSASGDWAGHDHDIAQFGTTTWLFTDPTLGDQVLNVTNGAVLKFNGASWVAADAPHILRSVDFIAEPVVSSLKVDGTSWLNGGNVVTMDSSNQFSVAWPAGVFVDDSSAGVEDDFAWWISRNEYYRFVGGSWMVWGKSLYWLDPVRFRLPNDAHVVATTNALPALAFTGERYIVANTNSTGGVYVMDGIGGYAKDNLLAGDRFLVGSKLQIWNGLTMVTLADAGDFAGEYLYLLVQDEGMAYRRDGNGVWSPWGDIPSVEDYATTQDWNKQWSSSAQIYGYGQLRLLDGTTASSRDSDNDGLPDDWEISHGLDPNDATGNNGAAGDPDADGLSNLNEYLLGYDPQNEDTNGNGILDGNEDFDRDGLPNGYEQSVSGTRLDIVDTDDDGLTDYEEVIATVGTGMTSPINSMDPPIARSMYFNGDAVLTVENQKRHHRQSWGLLAWVKPDTTYTDEVVLHRSVPASSLSYTGTTDLVHFELGLEAKGNGLFAPYVRHVGLATSENGLSEPDMTLHAVETKVVAPETSEGRLGSGWLSAGEWTHLAGIYDADAHTMSLYVNGELVEYNEEAWAPGGFDFDPDKTAQGTLLIGASKRLTASTVENGFTGWLDEVQVLGGAIGANDVKAEYLNVLATGLKTLDSASNGTTFVQIPISEALAFEHTNGFVMVRFKNEDQAAATLSGLDMTLNRSYSIVPVKRVAIPAGMSMTDALSSLRSDSNVLYAEPDYIIRADRIPNDARFAEQWAYNEQNAGAIHGIEAWDYVTGSKDIVVAVIDTGVDYNHEDLADNMWVNTDEIPANGIDDDHNGYVDDYHGYNFSWVDSILDGPAFDPTDPMDRYGHGTHCAGILGAVGNNGVGVVGVNWKVKIMPVNFLGQWGMGLTSDAILALEYAWRNGARISNNSWGGGAYSQSLYDTIKMAGENGHLFVTSAGNSGRYNDNTNGLYHAYPSDYDLPNLISVAAIDSTGALADFSNYGEISVDLGAPGVSILSTTPGNTYERYDGTSMAAPYVAGGAALALAADPEMSLTSLRASLLKSVEKTVALEGKVVSGGQFSLPKVVGAGGSPVLYLKFDDSGATVEDFTKERDWNSKPSWKHAATPIGALIDGSEAVLQFTDTDGDGMPDWWEMSVGLDPYAASTTDGATGDPDGDGLSNLFEYLAGTNPSDPDTGRDNVGDFFADSDADGLSNGQEQQLGTHPGKADTDDDGVADGAEVASGHHPLNSRDPELARAMAFFGSGSLSIKQEKSSDSSRSWTVEAWVKPIGTGISGNAVLISRAEKYASSNMRWVDYELGLSNGVPYVSYAFRNNEGNLTTVRADGLKAISSDKWAHIAAVRDVQNLQVRLFVNGKCVKTTTAAVPAYTPSGVFTTVMGEHLVGQLDGIRVWDYVRTSADIQDDRGVLLPEANMSDDLDANRAPKRLFNFDDGGSTAENSYIRNDWMSGWQNAATLNGDASLVVSAWPPVDLDSDDDSSSDVAERTAGTKVLRSESPYVSRALSFKGSGRVEATEQVDGTETMLYAVTNWTAEIWVNPDVTMTNQGDYALLSRSTLQSGSRNFTIGLQVNSNGLMTAYGGFDRQDDGHAPFMVNTGSNTIPRGTWTHLAASFSAEDDRLILYKNGVEQIRGTATGAEPVSEGAGRVYLGSTGFTGMLKEGRVWSAVRTGDEVYANFTKSLMFSAYQLENAFHNEISYAGRPTDRVEDGYNFDHSAIAIYPDPYNPLPYRYGRWTHKFTLEAWVKMDIGASGGTLVKRQVLVDGTDLRDTESIIISGKGFPTVHWEGQIQLVTPIYEERNVSTGEGTNTTKQTVLKELKLKEELAYHDLISEVDIRDGQWHHVAAVGDSVGIRLFIDGTLDRETDTYHTFMLRDGVTFEAFYWQYGNGTSDIRVGDGTLNADIDEVLVWNMDKTQSEIQQHMESGLTLKDIAKGRAAIAPVPELAVDDEAEHADLVSYLTFDGTYELPYIPEEANSNLRYRLYPVAFGNEILKGTKPTGFATDSLRAFNRELIGYFSASDGGETVENLMRRRDLDYAGLLMPGVTFVESHGGIVEGNDRIPDWWEQLYGFDPASDLDDFADPDNDGLSNLAEFLAGTDPNNWDSNGDGVADYFGLISIGSGVTNTFGEYLMDGDQIDDVWEEKFTSTLSTLVNDANGDPDGDGWDNYSEYLGSGFDVMITSNAEDTAERVVAVYPTRPDDANSFPVPQISFTFLGNASANLSSAFTIGSDGRIVSAGNAILFVQAFSDLRMAKPDAQVVARLDGYFNSGCTFTAERWDTGHLRQGTNVFMAFIDENGDGQWNAPEWMGYSYGDKGNGCENIQFGSHSVSIALMDKPAGYIRFSWEQNLAVIGAALDRTAQSSYIVHVKSLSTSGQPVMYSAVRDREAFGRPYVTEMDFIQAGISPLNGDYAWYITSLQDTVSSNIFAAGSNRVTYSTATMKTPELLSPVPATLTYQKNSLRVMLESNSVENVADNTPQLTVTLSGNGVSKTETHYVGQAGFVFGVAEVPLTWLAGTDVPNGDYTLTLQSRTPIGTSPALTVPITIRVSDGGLGGGSISGHVLYKGKKTGTIRVLAYEGDGYSGIPAGQSTLDTNGNYRILGLRSGAYTVQAVVDSNGDGRLSANEAWGVVKMSLIGNSVTPYAASYVAKKIQVVDRSNVSGQDIVAYDGIARAMSSQDSDADGLSNAREIELGLNPFLWDNDFDGLNDYQEISVCSTDPLNQDTDRDGMPDGWEVSYELGALSPVDAGWESDWLQNAQGIIQVDSNGNRRVTSDGLTNLQEYQHGTNPRNVDTDGDGLKDGYEVLHSLNPLDSSDATQDADSDGLTNLQEYSRNTDPNRSDSDDDGLNDGDEVLAGTNLLFWDSDGDGYGDGVEVASGSNPLIASNIPSSGRANTRFLSVLQSNNSIVVVYQVESLVGNTAILDFMLSRDLKNGQGWTSAGVQKILTAVDVGTVRTNVIPNTNGVVNVRIRSR